MKESTYPETHWPPEGSDFEAKYQQAIAETDDAARCAIIEEMQREEYEEGGNIIPIFNNLIDATPTNVQGLRRSAERAQPRPLRPRLQEHLAPDLRT